MGQNLSQRQVDHGSTKPFKTLYPNTPEFDQEILTNLIVDRKLAPFYPGQDSCKIEIPRITRSSSSSSLVSLQELCVDPIECPICFLYYPRNINYTRCCDQPICTDCFLQIKRSEITYQVCTCPYCVVEDFGVVYYPPNSKNNTHRKSISPKDVNVVTSDMLRPDWRRKMLIKERERQRLQQQLQYNQSRLRHFQLFESDQLTSAAEAAANLLEGRGRNVDGSSFGYLQAMSHMGADIEELMIMEAIRQSLAEQQGSANQQSENTVVTQGNQQSENTGVTQGNQQVDNSVPPERNEQVENTVVTQGNQQSENTGVTQGNQQVGNLVLPERNEQVENTVPPERNEQVESNNANANLNHSENNPENEDANLNHSENKPENDENTTIAENVENQQNAQMDIDSTSIPNQD